MFLAASAVGLAVLSGPALAQTADDGAYVGGETVVRGGELHRDPQGDGDTRGRALPVTGGDIAGLVAIGAAAVGTGTVLVRRTRRSADA